MKFFMCIVLFIASASAGFVTPAVSTLAYGAAPIAPIASIASIAAPISTAYTVPITTAYTAPISTVYAGHVAAPLAYNAYGAGLYGSGYSGYGTAFGGFLKKKK